MEMNTSEPMHLVPISYWLLPPHLLLFYYGIRSASDLVTNLIVLLLLIRNAGLDGTGLMTHLSDAMADGTLTVCCRFRGPTSRSK